MSKDQLRKSETEREPSRERERRPGEGAQRGFGQGQKAMERDELSKALEDTFPASDPISAESPLTPGASPQAGTTEAGEGKAWKIEGPLPFAAGFSSLEAGTPATPLSVRGRIPGWLRGALIRTAPCKFNLSGGSLRHWFDGLAMLHRFGFRDGHVIYASRFLRSNAFQGAMREGRPTLQEFASGPRRSPWRRFTSLFTGSGRDLTDNANVSVNAMDGAFLAYTETAQPIRFDAESLETLGHVAYGPGGSASLSTAHPHYDAKRRCSYNYVTLSGVQSRYRFLAFPAGGPPRVLAELPAAAPCYVHSFGMTRNTLVFTEFPLVIPPLELALSTRPFADNLRWQPERGLRFHLLHKDTGELLRTAETSAAFAFHHVNAYESGNAVAADIVIYPNADIIRALYWDKLRRGTPVDTGARLTRYIIPLDGRASIRQEPLSQWPLELPRIHYARAAGEPYRFVWGVSTVRPGNFSDAILKVDVETGFERLWREEKCYPGEPVFVPAPGGGEEDNGILLSIVFDAREKNSFLLVLDAHTLEELGRASCPHQIPFGFHGNFFPETATGIEAYPAHR